MFDVGFWELVLIFGVGLIILGPERMPRIVSQLGRWIGRARRTASSLRRQLEQEIAMSDYKPPPPPPKRKPTHITPVNSPNAAKDAEQNGAEPENVGAPGTGTGAEPGTEPGSAPEPDSLDGTADDESERRAGGS